MGCCGASQLDKEGFRTFVYHGPGRFSMEVGESGDCTVTSLQSCHWIAARRPDPRFWFAMPPLRNPCSGISIQTTVGDQGAGNRAGYLHLHLIRKGKPVVPRRLLLFAEHAMTPYNIFIPQNDPIVQESQPGDLYLVQRTIGGPYGCGHELKVASFSATFMSNPQMPCFSRPEFYASPNYLDMGHYGKFGNTGDLRDNGHVRYDRDLSWLDFGRHLNYPRHLLLAGGGTGGLALDPKSKPKPKSDEDDAPEATEEEVFYFEDDGTGGYDGGAGENDVGGGGDGGGGDGGYDGWGGDGGYDGGGGDGGYDGGGGDGGYDGGGGDGGGGGGGGDE